MLYSVVMTQQRKASRTHLVALMVGALAYVGCADDEPNDVQMDATVDTAVEAETGVGAETGVDERAVAREGGGYCCLPDPDPCPPSQLGGYSEDGDCSGTFLEGNDGAFDEGVDEYGCEVWIDRGIGPGALCCGCPPDAGIEADAN